MSNLKQVASDWLAVRTVIATYIEAEYGETKRDAEDQAAAIIARVATAGYMFDKIEDEKPETTPEEYARKKYNDAYGIGKFNGPTYRG